MKAFTAVCLLALASVAAAQKFSAANVVDTWEACPVKKPTEWAPKDFDSSLDSLTQLTEYTKDLSKACQDSLLDLAGCASDNDAFADPPSTITSLSTSNGCCLTDCSNNIKKAIAQGCFNDLLKVICKDPKASKYKTGLFNAGARCADFTPSCDAIPANATLAANATAAVKGAVANATTAAKTAVTAAAGNATAALAGAAKDAVAKVTGGAGAVAASAVMAVAGAAALLVL